MTTELQGQRTPAPPAPVLTSECTHPTTCERTVVAVSCAQLGGGQEALYTGGAWPKARAPKVAGTSVTVQMWVLWAVVFEFWCDRHFGPGQGYQADNL